MGRSAKVLVSIALAEGLVFVALAYARPPRQDQPSKQDQSQQDKKKEAKERKRREKDLFNELDSQYKKWLNEDVVYIITPEERSTFLHLSTNEEREQFIEAFWARRNPDPDSPENTFKEEHYRRIAYANEHYASGIPGWKTDRGRIYIMWGPPDEIDSHPSGGTYERPPEEGGGETTTYPFEDWRYRYLEGWGENIMMEFVDPTMTGEYHLTMDPSEKDALTYVPGAGLTMAESMGMANKAQRFQNTDGTHMAENEGGFGQTQEYDEFTRLENYAHAFQAPPVKFKDLEAVVTSRLVRDQVKFDYRFDFLRITSDTVLVPITVQIPTRQLSFKEADGVDTATMNLFARLTTLSGRIVQTFEDTLNDAVPASLLQKSLTTSQIYQKAVPLSPGLYRLDIVLKDTTSGNVGVVNTRLAVPRFQDDQLSSSSLILADDIHRVSSKDIGLGQFVLGDVKVRPKLDGIFTSDDSMGVFLQVYNLKVDDKTHRADASVEFRVLRDKVNDPVLKFDLPQNKLPEHGEELTLENRITLGSLAPGKYKLEVAVTDNLAKQTITPVADFTVKAAPPQASQAPPGR
ncbi:MAG TPA: GWxTD domain-containing protein [Candidatus Limnocylindrales bacterium]|nr:GWxTD domain-containing protein [Candidatus Limnocylindrales bacterium]